MWIGKQTRVEARNHGGAPADRQTHTFARDLRTWSCLSDAMQEHAPKLPKIGARVRGLLNALLELGGDTRKSVRGRLRDVAGVFDAPGEG
jgi:hypothetical protein